MELYGEEHIFDILTYFLYYYNVSFLPNYSKILNPINIIYNLGLLCEINEMKSVI